MNNINDATWIHDLDPVHVSFAGIEIRHYGILFALTMVQ